MIFISNKNDTVQKSIRKNEENHDFFQNDVLWD